MNVMTRRKILAAIARIAAATTLTSCGMSSDEEPAAVGAVDVQASDLEMLASVAYELFPYQSLSPEHYVKVANAILALNDSIVTDGLMQLRALSNEQSWLALPDAERISILAEMQESNFFGLMRANTITIIYSEPAFFELVGYGGSAIEYGGYLNRGFDDIDWLPEQEAGQ